MPPQYLQLHSTGELADRVKTALELLRCCTVCPQNCKVDRISGNLGVCGIGEFASVSSYGPHFGEESPLVGSHGSGTIFFSSCNLRCIFCQNYEISHFNDENGYHLSTSELGAIMLELQEKGCHNINFVTPTHVIPQILAALPEAIDKGLRLPLIYNCSGYESLSTLKILDGIIDIYMPDFKFWNNSTAELYTHTSNYADITREAIREMYNQVGNLRVDEQGIATKGLLIRHLVMPNHLLETEEILNFIVTEVSPHCSVNIMDQYRPCGQATDRIDRELSGDEYQQALDMANKTELVQLNENRLSELLKRLGFLR